MHSDLNPYRLSQVLGGTVQVGTRSSFGNFAMLAHVGEGSKNRPEVSPDIEFTDTDDEVIAKAFERMRSGLSADRFLADPKNAHRFAKLCQRLGLKYPVDAINLRLLGLRKASGGGLLERTTVRPRHPGLVEKYGPAVEFAMVKLATRFGASVDDLLADPDYLGNEFESVARTIIPGGSPVEYRVCALQIRKSRHLEKQDRSLFDELDSGLLIREFEESGTLFKPNTKAMSEEPGIVLLSEPDRPLFIGRYGDLQSAVVSLRDARITDGFARHNNFWVPDPRKIGVSVLEDSELKGKSSRVATLRLIHDLCPALNWPVHIDRKAA